MRSIVFVLPFAVLITANTSGCCEGASDVAELAGGGFRFYQEISSAPGTKAMRATGCKEAFVITPESMAKFASTVQEVTDQPDGGSRKEAPKLEITMAICQVEKRQEAPTCEDVTKAFVSQAEPTADFGVVVTAKSGGETLCEGLFNRQGIRVSDLPKNAEGSVDTGFLPRK